MNWRKLLVNTTGNVLVLTAAVMIPLSALIGSSVDMGRAYLAQTRLQSACDAGALAGRRAMTGTSVDTAVVDEARKFFEFNFPIGTAAVGANPSVSGAYGVLPFSPVIEAGATDTTVRITASTALPTTIMNIFGYTQIPISVTCDARVDFVNTDIVLVLDNTGSMKCAASASAASSCSSEVSGSKMQGMRDAVMALYDQLEATQTDLTTAGLRLRYGVVPFSGTVNVGKILYGANTSYIRPTSSYYRCTNTNNNNTNCTGVGSYNVTRNNAWMTSNNWAGCIEERQTVNSINSTSGLNAPANAFDHDIDMVPTSTTASKWGIYDPSAQTGYPNGTKPQTACPTEAKILQEWTRGDLLSYMNTLVADGGTYTNIGMLWGVHMVSRDGVFAYNNPTTYGNMKVNKYIILMTDGYIDGSSTYYSAYGQEGYQHRMAIDPYPGDTTLEANMRRRFDIACQSAKSRDVSVWVVAFGLSLSGGLDTSLANCASNSDQAAYVTNSAALISKFQQIGQKIGALRLTT